MSQLTPNQKEDLAGIMVLATEWLLIKKIGSITFHFFKGGIANYVMNESGKINPNRKKTDGRSDSNKEML